MNYPQIQIYRIYLRMTKVISIRKMKERSNQLSVLKRFQARRKLLVTRHQLLLTQ